MQATLGQRRLRDAKEMFAMRKQNPYITVALLFARANSQIGYLHCTTSILFRSVISSDFQANFLAMAFCERAELYNEGSFTHLVLFNIGNKISFSDKLQLCENQALHGMCTGQACALGHEEPQIEMDKCLKNYVRFQCQLFARWFSPKSAFWIIVICKNVRTITEFFYRNGLIHLSYYNI